MYEESMETLGTWWPRWRRFMFEEPISPRKGDAVIVGSLLKQIPRAKYPAVTEKEEALSVPLQILCLAVFDAILVHMLNKGIVPWTLASSWSTLKPGESM